MELFWLIGAVIFLFVYLLDRKVLAFDKDVYLRYAKYIALCSAAAIVINTILGRFPPLPTLSFGTLLMVGWEDLLFSLLLIYYPMRFFHPVFSVPLAIVASLAFGLGHIYQGLLWAVVTCFYPFYISYRGGKKYGYGTVICLHVSYDVSVYLVLVVLNYVKNL